MEKTEVSIQTFEIIERNKDLDKRYVQVKVSKFQVNNNVRNMLQIIDCTGNVLYHQQKYLNETLAMINSCVSHELRNPLNSIKALNYEKEHVYSLIDEYIENEDFTKEMIVSNLKIAMK